MNQPPRQTQNPIISNDYDAFSSAGTFALPPALALSPTQTAVNIAGTIEAGPGCCDGEKPINSKVSLSSFNLSCIIMSIITRFHRLRHII